MAVSARHYARLGVVQFLYAWNVQEQSLSGAQEQILLDSEVLMYGDMRYLQKLLNSIPPKIPKIDSILSGAMHRKLEHIDPVELSILRLGVYELMEEPDVPKKVVTNECVELSKEFGNPGSYKFINGTLDKIAFGDSSNEQSADQTVNGSSKISELDLIKKYFTRSNAKFENVVKGVGDDSAIVGIPAGKQLIVSTDTLLENIHFPVSTKGSDIGYKSLAVALSDLAAMGASPEFATLNLSLPRADENWLEQFSTGFFEIADEFGVALIGGDTVRGPMGITVTVMGSIDEGASLMRKGAQPGDGIYVTGTLGDAALGLMISGGRLQTSEKDANYLKKRLNRPTPRIAAANELRKFSSSAIDISDGLIADLNHILVENEVGAEINLKHIPLSEAYKRHLSAIGWDPAISHGDDYELCLTIPEAAESGLVSRMNRLGFQIARIGKITSESGLTILETPNKAYRTEESGYSHF